MTKNRSLLVRALSNLLGVNDVHGPYRKKITPMDVHALNGGIVIDGVNYSEGEAYALVVEILRRLPKQK